MEKLTCQSCPHLEPEEFGLWCPILDKRIYVINEGQKDPFCKTNLIYIREKRVWEYPSLKAVHTALGEVHDSAYYEQRRKEKTFTGNYTEWRHSDGSYKTKQELLFELKELRNKAMKIVHPDKKLHFDEEAKVVNLAYNRGVELIERKFKQW